MRHRYVFALILCLAMVGAIAAEAGESSAVFKPEAYQLEAGLFGGVMIPSGRHELFDPTVAFQQSFRSVNPDFGLRVGYWPLRFLGAEIEGALVPSKTDDGDSAFVIGFRGHVMGQFPMIVTPFVVAGAGALGVSSADDVLGRDLDFAFHVGAGAKYHVLEFLALRVDGRANFSNLAGSSRGYTPHFEVLFGVSYTVQVPEKKDEEPVEEPVKDTDNDGIDDNADACIDQPEDKDNFEDSDGCPDDDNDKDGIKDASDKCPDEAETVNQIDDDDGCPDAVGDTDEDGLMDNADKCPMEPEDKDNFEDEDGCPDFDNDQDGVKDAGDNCPNEAGATDNFGCPVADKDSDGIMDRVDNCPEKAGPVENEGCPVKQLVKIVENKIVIKEKIYFALNAARIKRKSWPLLKNVAQVVKNHPEITMVRIEGFADPSGNKDFNRKLSQKRADAVRKFLIKEGVEGKRLQSVGRGEVDVAGSAAKDRRVEFNIVSE